MKTRRQLLSGASCGIALLPFCHHVEAMANGSKMPKRFIFMTVANGIDPAYLLPETTPHGKSGSTLSTPQAVENIVSEKLDAASLSSWMKPLAPVLDHTTMISGLSGKMCRGWHSVGFGTLGAHASGDKGKPGGETLDGALSKVFPSVFPHVGLSANGRPSVSAVGPGNPLPVFSDPLEIYNHLFGVLSDDKKAKRRNRFDGKLMDFMAEDVRKFRQRVPSSEKEKLESYLTAFEQMSDRHGQLLAKRDELKKRNIKTPGDELNWEDRVESMCDLVSQAMISGLTNVAAINTDGNGTSGATYGKRSGFSTPTGGHGFGHGPTHKRVKPFGYNIEMMAKMAQTFAAIREGDGTMLDNTLILMVSTSGSTHHTRCVNFPMVLVGNTNKKLKMGNRIQVPNYGSAKNHTIGTLYTTILHAAGIDREGFGTLDPSTPRINQTQPLSALI